MNTASFFVALLPCLVSLLVTTRLEWPLLLWWLWYHKHDYVIKWKHFPRYWPFVRVIHRWPVNSPHKGQWRGALMFSLMCAWINASVNNREAGDWKRHRAHYDVIVMACSNPTLCTRYCPQKTRWLVTSFNLSIFWPMCEGKYGLWPHFKKQMRCFW